MSSTWAGPRVQGRAAPNEPKLTDPMGRYVIVTFVQGTNMGPYEAARHIPGVSGHELSYVANKHFSIQLLNEAVADLVNAHARLDISPAWDDGTAVAADGTHMDTYLDNLLSETSVRYGKPGRIAYHHVSDTYIALFTHFIPCGVWEAAYIIEGLLKNTSEVQPTTVHADTKGQSFPVFALAHLLGFDLMPRRRPQVHDYRRAVAAELKGSTYCLTSVHPQVQRFSVGSMRGLSWCRGSALGSAGDLGETRLPSDQPG
ncbi:Tn3 family transposase [Streptomyces halstedii]|nr:Tn3 family transposase [Streptomyces griseolus]